MHDKQFDLIIILRDINFSEDNNIKLAKSLLATFFI